MFDKFRQAADEQKKILRKFKNFKVHDDYETLREEWI